MDTYNRPTKCVFEAILPIVREAQAIAKCETHVPKPVLYGDNGYSGENPRPPLLHWIPECVITQYKAILRGPDDGEYISCVISNVETMDQKEAEEREHILAWLQETCNHEVDAISMEAWSTMNIYQLRTIVPLLSTPGYVAHLERIDSPTKATCYSVKTIHEWVRGKHNPNEPTTRRPLSPEELIYISELYEAYIRMIGKLFKVVRSDDTVQMKQLLDGGINVNTENEFGQTFLHIACRSSSVQMVKLLLDYGANPNGHADLPLTPLSAVLVARQEPDDLVMLLMDRGAYVTPNDLLSSMRVGIEVFQRLYATQPTWPERLLQSLMVKAIQHKSYHIFDYLTTVGVRIDNYTLEERDLVGMTPEAVRMLIEKGADVISLGPELIRWIVTRNDGADAEWFRDIVLSWLHGGGRFARTEQGRTSSVLSLVTERPFFLKIIEEYVSELERRGDDARMIQQVREEPNTGFVVDAVHLLVLVCRIGWIEVIQWLFDEIIERDEMELLVSALSEEALDANRLQVAVLLAERGGYVDVHVIHKVMDSGDAEIFRRFYALRTWDPYQKADLLIRSAYKERREIFDFLVEQGAKSASHIGTRRDVTPDQLERLIEYGVIQVNAPLYRGPFGSDSHTFLFNYLSWPIDDLPYANDVIEVLLRHGANPLFREPDGQTAMDIARPPYHDLLQRYLNQRSAISYRPHHLTDVRQ